MLCWIKKLMPLWDLKVNWRRPRAPALGYRMKGRGKTLLRSFTAHGATARAMLWQRGGTRVPHKVRIQGEKLHPFWTGQQQDSSWCAVTRSSIRPLKHWRPSREWRETDGKTWLIDRKLMLQPAQETLQAGKTPRTGETGAPSLSKIQKKIPR